MKTVFKYENCFHFLEHCVKLIYQYTFIIKMVDILDIIKSRRTVKQFVPKILSWEKIARILDAARYAPSCGNIQNWKFIVALKPESKQQIAENTYDQIEIVQAGALIVVCAEIDKAQRYYGLRGERLYSIQNCAAAIENMLLQAHSMGLGSRWIGAFDEDSIKIALKVPENIRIQAIIAVGHTKNVPPKPPKYPLETIVYFHSWRNKIRDPAKYMNDIATILARKAKETVDTIKKTGKSFQDILKK